MPFSDLLVAMVNSGHTQTYIDQFEEYAPEDELRAPTEEDLRPARPDER